MSAITRAIQHAEMVKDIERIKRVTEDVEALMAATIAQRALLDEMRQEFNQLVKSIEALKQKRGPGRPKKDQDAQ